MPSFEGQPGDRATCAVCGASVALGYAGRLTVHECPEQGEPETTAGASPGRQAARVA